VRDKSEKTFYFDLDFFCALLRVPKLHKISSKPEKLHKSATAACICINYLKTGNGENRKPVWRTSESARVHVKVPRTFQGRHRFFLARIVRWSGGKPPRRHTPKANQTFMTRFRLQVIDFLACVFVPEKTAVIYRRKTIRGNMLSSVVAAHTSKQLSLLLLAAPFSGMCALSEFNFRLLLCRLTFLHSNSDTEAFLMMLNSTVARRKC
jgi:hypothetical protein